MPQSLFRQRIASSSRISPSTICRPIQWNSWTATRWLHRGRDTDSILQSNLFEPSVICGRSKRSSMVKIAKIECLQLRAPQSNSADCDGTVDTAVIRVTADNGVYGLGETDAPPNAIA